MRCLKWGLCSPIVQQTQYSAWPRSDCIFFLSICCGYCGWFTIGIYNLITRHLFPNGCFYLSPCQQLKVSTATDFAHPKHKSRHWRFCISVPVCIPNNVAQINYMNRSMVSGSEINCLIAFNTKQLRMVLITRNFRSFRFIFLDLCFRYVCSTIQLIREYNLNVSKFI